MTDHANLFRPEAVEAQNAFNGRVRIAPPMRWMFVNLLLVVLVAGALVFASFANYARTVQAAGVIDTTSGTPIIAAQQQGRLDLKVKVGDTVKPGDVIAITHAVARNADGDLADIRRDASLDEAESADLMASSAQAAGRARAQAQQARADAATSRLASLDEQLRQARERTARARSDLERARQIAERGFLSRSDLDQRESAVAERRQAEAMVAEQIALARGERESAIAEAAQATQEAESLAFDARSTASRARRSAVEADALAQIVHVANAAGEIASLPLRDGALLQPGDTIAVIVPQDSRKVARISVPAAAMSDLRPGQPIRVAIDAYPFQTFGTVNAKVASVSQATTMGEDGPIFIVEAQLPETLPFYNGKAELLPGMTLNARITTRERSFLAWLLDPLLAVSRR